MIALIGCSDDVSGPDSAPSAAASATVTIAPPPPAAVLNEDRDDPAMVPDRRLGTGHSAGKTAPGAGGSTGRVDEAVLRIDPETNAVYVPGLGWQSAEAFMDIYLNRPELLPDQFDHEAVQALKERLAQKTP